MGTGNQLHELIVVGLITWLLYWWISRNEDGLNVGMYLLGLAVVGAGFLYVALIGGVTIGVTLYENNKIKQCQTVHERIAKARAAPNDYFGTKMRTDADAEQTSCTELAARLAEREKNPDDLEVLRQMIRR